MAISIPAVASSRIKYGTLIKLTVNGSNYYIANTYAPITYLGDSYIGLGHFLGIDQIQDDLKTTNNGIQISLSGIPKYIDTLSSPVVEEQGLGTYTSYVALILDQKIKGSLVKIYRAFFDPDTDALLTDSVSMRFSGYISNYSITDAIDLEARTNTKTVIITCSSLNGILERQISGRRTNQTDQRSLYPDDSSMDRVAIIANTAFDFGKPYTGGIGGGSGSETYNDISQAG